MVWSVTVKTIYGDAGPGLSKYSVSMIEIVTIKSIKSINREFKGNCTTSV